MMQGELLESIPPGYPPAEISGGTVPPIIHTIGVSNLRKDRDLHVLFLGAPGLVQHIRPGSILACYELQTCWVIIDGRPGR